MNTMILGTKLSGKEVLIYGGIAVLVGMIEVTAGALTLKALKRSDTGRVSLPLGWLFVTPVGVTPLLAGLVLMSQTLALGQLELTRLWGVLGIIVQMILLSVLILLLRKPCSKAWKLIRDFSKGDSLSNIRRGGKLTMKYKLKVLGLKGLFSMGGYVGGTGIFLICLHLSRNCGV